MNDRDPTISDPDALVRGARVRSEHPPGDSPLRWQRVNRLAEQGELTAARVEALAITDHDLAVRAWQLLSQLHGNDGDWPGALSALEHLLRLQPQSRPLRLQHALVLDRCGQVGESLSELLRLVDEDCDSPQLLSHVATALAHSGRVEEAESRLLKGLHRWPVDPQLHTNLAQLRWLRGAELHATARLEEAIRSFPQELRLYLLAADLQRKAGLLPQALETLQRGLSLAPESAGFLTSIGVVLDSLDRLDEALVFLRRAVARAPDSQVLRRNLIPTLLRLVQPHEALALSDGLLRLAPDDQQLVAYRATALRLLADPGYRRLHDYQRLVRVYRPSVPGQYAGMTDFNRELAKRLAELHRYDQRPLDQSLRGGTQTQRNLPAQEPVVAALFAMMDAPIRDYIGNLGEDSDHPTDRRKTAAYRFAGSWSVQLKPGGFHINHVHPMGWLSSAYYVDVPAMDDAVGKSGWLRFGEPGFAVQQCPADFHVRPEPGMLVLFPSYMWHGTVPFHDGERRLTAAFDVVPRRSR